MKKFIAILLVLLTLGCSLVGCAKKEAEPAEPTEGPILEMEDVEEVPIDEPIEVEEAEEIEPIDPNPIG